MKNRDFNTIARTDIGDLIVHWTKRNRESKESAFEVLLKILEQNQLKGSNGYIKGSFNCVCFTESPIADIVKVFMLSKASEKEKHHRYEPFGIAVKKDWLYKQGGRPVLYSDSDTYKILPDELKWRYVNFDPPGIDFTWEREWRLMSDILKLSPDQCAVIVPSKNYVNKIIDLHGNKWLTLTLSILGLPSNWE